MLRLTELTSLADLIALRDAWLKLWQRCPSATPFQTPDWLLPWWTHLGGGQICAMALYSGERLVGLAPLFVHGWRDRRQVSPLGVGISDYLDPLFEPGFAECGSEQILSHLAEIRARWDVCHWQELRDDSPLLAALVPGRLCARAIEQQGCVILPLPASVDKFQSQLSKERRRKLRRAMQHLQRVGTVQFIRADADSVVELLECLFRLHVARWKKRDEPGVLADTRIRAFHREAAANLQRSGCLRLRAIWVDARPASVLYGFVGHGRAHAYLGGFDPALDFGSPGTLLSAHAIEQSIAEGCREYDFLRGAEEHKFAWGAQQRAHRQMWLWHDAPPVELEPSWSVGY